mgnify:CR=1 FL=1
MLLSVHGGAHALLHGMYCEAPLALPLIGVGPFPLQTGFVRRASPARRLLVALQIRPQSWEDHIIPHDVNETFTQPHTGGLGRGRCGRRGPRSEGLERERPPRGERPDGEGPPRGEGGPQIKGVELAPLIAAKDESKLLLYKLLAFDEWREHYLGYVRDVAATWLDWEKLGSIATDLHTLIAEDVKAGTRKLASTEAFLASLSSDKQAAEDAVGDRRQSSSISLKKFAADRRAYLLNYKSTCKY